MNLEVLEDSIGSIQYLSHQSGRRISKLEANVGKDECSLMQRMPSRRVTRWPKGGSATYRRRNGLTVNLFKCVPKRAKIMELTYCVEHVPVEVGKRVKYVNLGTNMLIPHSLVIPCSKLFPVVVQEVSGKWKEF